MELVDGHLLWFFMFIKLPLNGCRNGCPVNSIIFWLSFNCFILHQFEVNFINLLPAFLVK